MTPSQLSIAMGIPLQRAFVWADPITSAMLKYDISKTPERISAFIGQIGHESDGLSWLEENLMYSAPRLCAVWPTRFYLPPDGPDWFKADGSVIAKGRAKATDYEWRQIATGNRAYAGRNGNGNEDSGDGYIYRARGPIGLTGLANYKACGEGIGFDLAGNPGLVLQPAIGALTAGWFWHARNCNALVDAGDFRGLTIAINGGLLGFEDRASRMRVALNAVNSGLA